MLLDNLPHLATAKRRRRTPDGQGGYVDTFPTTVFADLHCWRQQASDREVLWWSQRDYTVTHKVYFAEDPGVDTNCVLEVGGDRMDVVSDAEPDVTLGMGIAWRVMCKKIGKTS